MYVVDDSASIQSFLFIEELGHMSPCTFTSPQSSRNLKSITCAADILRMKEGFETLQMSKD